MQERGVRMYDAISQSKGFLALVSQTGMSRQAEVVALATAAELIFRAAHLLALESLHDAHEQFQATQQALMVHPDASLQVVHDARADEAEYLTVRDLLDLLSELEEPCVSPRLHRGWQDRTKNCQHARRVAQGALGFTLSDDEQKALLKGWALCNRFFRMPAPVDVDVSAFDGLVDTLRSLVKRLAAAAGQSDIDALADKL